MSEVQRFEGQLVMWNGERGFGAIVPRQGGQELFVHVSAFPRDGAPPAVNELISFEVVSDGEGRKRAARVLRLNARDGRGDAARVLAPTGGAMALRRRREERRRRLSYTVLGLTLAVAVLAWMQFSVQAPMNKLKLASSSQLSSGSVH
jgi:cold shock CspA family protein